MTDLANRLLASLENHGRSRVDGVYKLYAHETKAAIDIALDELKKNGWVKITFHSVQVGPSKKEKRPFNVSRTSKQMYSEQKLFDPEL